MTPVGLICTTQVDLGLRAISGALKARGIETRCFFLDSINDDYPDDVLSDLIEALNGVLLVGISLVEMGKARAIKISDYLRHRGKLVIWGGAYPTLAPLEAMEHADFVCIGEGDDVMPALLRALETGIGVTEVPNLMYREPDGTIRTTTKASLNSRLDELPFPDYFTPGKHFDLTTTGRLRRMEMGFPRMERSTLRFERNLWVMFGRGCHLKCTYCSVPTLGKMSEGLGKFFRFKSPTVMIEELEVALRETGGADYIYIFDNDFCAQPLRKIEEFCRLYRERIRIPFFCYGTPLTISKEKVAALLAAGVERLDFGIQSGSDRVLSLYNRAAKQADILNAAEAIASAIHEATPSAENYPRWKLKPYFDVIFNAPFEERSDLQETIKVIKYIGGLDFDFGLYCQPLTFFRNTGLHDQVVQGELGDIDIRGEEYYASLSYQQIAEHIIGRGKHVYLNTLIYWMRYDHTRRWAGIIPRRLLPLLTSDPVVGFFERVNDTRFFAFVAKLVNLMLPTRDRRYFMGRRLRSYLASARRISRRRLVDV